MPKITPFLIFSAGRVQPGICFRLYSEALYNTLPEHWQPEMQRMPLESLCLHILGASAVDHYRHLLTRQNSKQTRFPSTISFFSFLNITVYVIICSVDSELGSPKDLLASALTPPKPSRVDDALETLTQVVYSTQLSPHHIVQHPKIQHGWK